MDLAKFMRNYARETGGQFSAYDDQKSIIVVPLDQGRFQTIIAYIKPTSNPNKELIEISSKICQYRNSLDLLALMRENGNLNYACFSVVDEYLKIEASLSTQNASEEVLKDIIIEVAEAADHWEQRLTGADVH